MRLCIIAAPDRSMSSSVDAAMIDGAALAEALRRVGHDASLISLPNQDATWLQRGFAAVETVQALSKLALQRPAPDAVIVMAPPHAAALAAELVAALRGIPGAVVLTAMMAEARMRTGELGREGVLAWLVPALENAVVRRSRSLVVPTEALRRRALLKGAQATRVTLARDLFAPLIQRPDDGRIARLRSDLGEGADCLVVLPAALGASTDLGALMGALTRLRHDHNIAFAAVGGGSRAQTLKDMIAARGIKNASVVPLSRADRRAAVHAADILLGIAVPAHDGLCVPRAISRSLWAGKPLVAVGPETSELVREVKRLDLGPCVGPGDGDGLATVLRSLATDREAREALATKAREAGLQMGNPLHGILDALSTGGALGAEQLAGA